MDVSSFEACVQALDDPARAASASSALEALRASASTLPLLRAVVSTSTSPAAQFHAVLTVRAVCVRAWPSLAPGERAGARAWLLNIARERGHTFAAPVVTALIVASAVLWKRGWLEECGTGAGGGCGGGGVDD